MARRDEVADAGANQQSYCGYLIASTSSGYSCYSSYANLTYNEARYTGGGNINALRAGLRGAESVTLYGTFTSLCFTTRAYSRGGLGQNDGGANHTIYGSVDDSLNHTGCYS